jgi:cytochrome c oxidase subunit 1
MIHDTSFIVAHFHYVMFGVTGFGLFAALHYWFPKMFGKMYNERVSKVAFWHLFVGFNTLYFPMFIMGWLGMPRSTMTISRVSAYHLISTIDPDIVAGVLIMITNDKALLSKNFTEKNPWGGEH